VAAHRDDYETNLSAEPTEAEKRARLPQADEHEKRTQSAEKPPAQGQKSVVRLRPPSCSVAFFPISGTEQVYFGDNPHHTEI
jgi:hypothetical protein